MIYESAHSVVAFCPLVIKKLNKYRQGWAGKTEACGVLLGEGDIDRGIYSIVKITTPMLRDIRRRTYFRITDGGHQRTIEREWNRSSGNRFYLGFWHTHPESFPKPSRLDMANWGENYTLNEQLTPSMFFPIVGLKEISIWEFGAFGMVKMSCINE